MEAMQSRTLDVVKRMKEITLVLQTPEQVLVEHGVTPDDIEGEFIRPYHIVSLCLILVGADLFLMIW